MIDGAPPPLFDALLARAKQLYSLPAVAMEVLRLTSSEQVDINALRGTIERDPALVARILKAVNSPLFRVGKAVANLPQAMTLLGIQPLKLLVLSFSLPRNLCSGEGEALGMYWRRTLAKAIAARHIAAAWLNGSPDEAFLAGLLQDIGILVLLKELGAPYGRLLAGLLGRSERLVAAEHALLGFEHTTLSARLLTQWGLPEPLTSAVAMPPSCDAILSLTQPLRTMAMTLHLADLAAELALAPRAESAGALAVVGRKYLGLKREQIEPLLLRLREELPPLAEMLRVTPPEGTDRLLIEAHERLAALQEDVIPQFRRNEPEEEALLADTEDLAAAVQRIARTSGPPAREASSRDAAELLERTAERLAREERSPRNASGETAVADQAVTLSRPLLAKLTSLLAACRALRWPLSLLLAEATLPPSADPEADRSRATALAAAERLFSGDMAEGSVLLPISERGVAILLAGRDRSAALEVARAWQQEFVVLDGEPGENSPVLRIGAATLQVVSPRFPAGELFAAARRCLQATGTSGGVDLKSIEL